MEVNLKRVSAMVSSEKMNIFYSEGTKNEETNSPSPLNGKLITCNNNMSTVTLHNRLSEK
jgi:hypothetical protein